MRDGLSMLLAGLFFVSRTGEVRISRPRTVVLELVASVSIPLVAGWRADHLGVTAFIQDVRVFAVCGSAVRAVEAP